MPPGGIYEIEDMQTCKCKEAGLRWVDFHAKLGSCSAYPYHTTPSVLPSCAVCRDSTQPGYMTYDFTTLVIRQLLSREEWASALPGLGPYLASRSASNVSGSRVYVRNDVKA